MDKLRAIQYFNQAVESGSLAAAARAFDVSTASVSQLIAALERTLGVALLHRTKQGISLTADGERYAQVTRRISADLHGVEQSLGARGATLRGTLTVGMRDSLGQNCVMPRIVRFIARHPDIDLVLKPLISIEEIDQKNVDVALLIGWPTERDLVVRLLAQTRLLVVASPAYWMHRGTPPDPEALSQHDCLVLRSTGGTQLDRWTFEKHGERRSIDVRSRLFSDERNWLYEAACAGAGVARLADLTLLPMLERGSLVPVLTDWEALEAPIIFAAYPPSQRRSKLVLAFVDFLAEVFAELENERPPLSPYSKLTRVPKPEWFGHARGRHSAFVARNRRTLA